MSSDLIIRLRNISSASFEWMTPYQKKKMKNGKKKYASNVKACSKKYVSIAAASHKYSSDWEKSEWNLTQKIYTQTKKK